MTEGTATITWIRELLEFDLGIRFYEGEHPGRFPLGLANQADATNLTWVNGKRVWMNQLWDVKAVDWQDANEGADPTTAENLQSMIDERMRRQTNQYTSDGKFLVVSCINEQELRYSERYGSDIYIHRGGSYRIRVQPIGG